MSTSIQLGESHSREFKSVFVRRDGKTVVRDRKKTADDVSRTSVAFANADGGELLIGVEDNGKVTGLGNMSEALIDYLEDAPKTRGPQVNTTPRC